MFLSTINYNKLFLLSLAAVLLLSSCKREVVSESYFMFDAPSLIIEHVLTIEDTPEHQIGDFYEFSLDSKGRLFIPDQALNKIHVFDDEGNLITTIGREGRGPGEFQRIVLSISPKDELFALDSQLFRTQQFVEHAGNWNLAHTFEIQREGMSFPLRAVSMGNTSILIEFLTAYSINPDSEKKSPFIRLIQPDGTILIDKVAELQQRDVLVVRTPTSVSVRPHPFGSEQHVFYKENVIYHAWGGGFDVLRTTVHEGASSTDTLFSHRIPSIPITSTDWQKAFAEFEFEDEFKRVARESEVAHKSKLLGLAVDDLNRIWIKRNVDEGIPNWAVFSETGILLFMATLPDRFRIMDIRENHIYGIYANEFDVSQVQVLRISE